MKAIKILLGVILTLGLELSGKEIVELSSKVENVTVYLQGAQVERSGAIKLKPGMNQIVFRDIANGINTSSIQASGKGDFIIMDVKYKTDYETVEIETSNDNRNEVKIRKRMGAIQDSIEWINFKLKGFAMDKDALNGEKNLILNNQLVKGQVDSFPILEELTGFYRVRIQDINKQLLEIERKEFYANKDKSRLNTEFAELNRVVSANPQKTTSKRVNKIIVTVSAENYVNGKMLVKYMVPSAGWSPLYDLRVEKESKDVQLVYKANVFQNSGENWDGVKLKLATANPNQRIAKPNMYTFFVDFYQAYIRQERDDYNRSRNARPEIQKESLSFNEGSVALSVADEELEEAPEAVYANSMTTVTENMLHMEYSIKLPYDIPSDGQHHMVYVQRENLNSKIEHYAVPKLDNRAYLLSKVTGLKELQLIPGYSNIFFDGTYLGQTYINTASSSDTLDLSLGIDRMVSISRKKKTEESKDMLTANKTIRTFEYEITVKNNKSKMVQLNLLDQIPVSRQKEIEVSLLDADKAEFNPKTGALEWNLELDPNEEKVITMKFSIKYPKDKQLNPIS